MGLVFNIQRFCLHDGPGIRTTVFLKGCPLRCVWCHNPESQKPENEVLVRKNKCVNCGACKAVCRNDCHDLTGGVHTFDFSSCSKCFACAEACPTKAIETVGKEYTADEVISTVIRDRRFYESSSGGMTLSGGEPLYQFDFAMELLKKAKKENMHTAIETCGFVSAEKLKQAEEYIDLFLYDYKETDGIKHKAFTGADNLLIIENLKRLKKPVILRCPIIPGCNDTDEHFSGIAEMTKTVDTIEKVEIEPYHSLGVYKNEGLGRENHAFTVPDQEMVDEWLNKLNKICACEVSRNS